MSTASGQWAEGVAAAYLVNKGFKLLGQNWKTRWCEIDIIAQKTARIHFVEVKFRKNSAFGSGLDYITPAKARQIEFAARSWVGDKAWEGDYQLDVIAITGEEDPQITYIPNAIGF